MSQGANGRSSSTGNGVSGNGSLVSGGKEVEPGVLRSAGFTFRDPELDPALARLYGVPRLAPAG